MRQLKKIRSKPKFSRWPPFDISNIFINLFNTAMGMITLTLYTKFHVNSFTIVVMTC